MSKKTSTFPLYDTLMKNLPVKDITIPQKNELIKKIGLLNKEKHELLFLLIVTFFIHQNKNSDDIGIPYEGKKMQDDKIEFDLSLFPPKLKQLLYKFIQLETKRIEEEIKLPIK